jgi:hypothetical protein
MLCHILLGLRNDMPDDNFSRGGAASLLFLRALVHIYHDQPDSALDEHTRERCPNDVVLFGAR